VDELTNALAWFRAAPGRLYEDGKENLQAVAQWIWEVIQGDFNEEQSTAQTITSTVIQMIPFVDQICDVRDLVANCKKIHADSSNKWHWVALALTLIGFFPTLGSLAKGCFKILLAYGRKGVFGAGKSALDSNMWKATQPYVENGIVKLNEFLARPEVRRTLKALKWDNPYRELARLARELSGRVNTGALTAEMDKLIGALNALMVKVQRWGGAALDTQAGQLLRVVKSVRDQADRQLGEVVAPVRRWVDQLARRLEIEADMKYRAYTNSLNPHAFQRPVLDAEVAQMRAHPPAWVDRGPGLKYRGLTEAQTHAGWPTLNNNSAKTFHNAVPVEYPPGTTLYRVVDPGSVDNSDCWMSKIEFDKLNSKDDWRRNFAVWGYWNKNGEYVTYTVPPGKPLRAWEGVTASQHIDETREFVLEGGARQIVIRPTDLDKSNMGRRQPTGWGYSNHGEAVSLLGVPTLTNNWREY
jgi:hypothetical protein